MQTGKCEAIFTTKEATFIDIQIHKWHLCIVMIAKHYTREGTMPYDDST